MKADGSAQRIVAATSADENSPRWGGVPRPAGVPPVLSLPVDMTVEATAPGGAVVTYEVTASDDEDPSPTVSCEHSTPSLSAMSRPRARSWPTSGAT